MSRGLQFGWHSQRPPGWRAENGGLQRIRHDEPTMFLARNHPASMRFVKKFWDWVRDARDYVRSRLG